MTPDPTNGRPTSGQQTSGQPMTHEESLELAGLYALDALTPDEKAEVDAHLADCPEEHPDFEELGGVTPALAALAEPVGAPAAMKRRVLDAYAAEHPRAWTLETPVDATVRAPTARAARSWTASNWMGWAAAGVMLLLLAVLGVYGLNLRQEANQANRQAEQLRQAVAALTAPGSQVAILHGSGSAAAVNGFAAFPTSGGGYVVMTDVPEAPTGMTYQGWFIANGTPVSAGLATVDAKGNVVQSGMQAVPGTEVVAYTLEPSGGSEQPTSTPIIVGEVRTPS